MLDFTKTQQNIFKRQDAIMDKVRNDKNYRHENVDEIQNKHVHILSKRIFGLKN